MSPCALPRELKTELKEPGSTRAGKKITEKCLFFLQKQKRKKKLLYSINGLSCKASKHVKYNPYNTLESKGTKKYSKNYTSSGGNVGRNKNKPKGKTKQNKT